MDEMYKCPLVCVPVAHGGGLRFPRLFGCHAAFVRFPDTPILKRRPIAASSSIHLQISVLPVGFSLRISSLIRSTSMAIPIFLILTIILMISDNAQIVLLLGRRRFYICPVAAHVRPRVASSGRPTSRPFERRGNSSCLI